MEEGGGGGQENGGGGGEGYDDGALPPLPEECGADKHPVVVLRSVYTREESEADPHFFDDLEVRYGTVRWCGTKAFAGFFYLLNMLECGMQSRELG